MALSVYVCSWPTGTATFYVKEQPDHPASIVGLRSPAAGEPAESYAIQEALRQLRAHLNRAYRSRCRGGRRRGHPEPAFVWSPSLEPARRSAGS